METWYGSAAPPERRFNSAVTANLLTPRLLLFILIDNDFHLQEE
jgi:hypothetical protein